MPIPEWKLIPADVELYYNRGRDVAITETVCDVRSYIKDFNISITSERPSSGPYTMGVIGASSVTACAAAEGEAGFAWGPPYPQPASPVLFAFGGDLGTHQVNLPYVIAHEFGHTMNLAHVQLGFHDVMQPELDGGPFIYGSTSVSLLDGTGTQNDSALIGAIAPGSRAENVDDCTHLGGSEDIEGYPYGPSWIIAKYNPDLGKNGVPITPNFSDFTYFESSTLGSGYASLLTELAAHSNEGESLLGESVLRNDSFGAIYWAVHVSVVSRTSHLQSLVTPILMQDPHPTPKQVSVGTALNVYLAHREHYNTEDGMNESLSAGVAAVGIVDWPYIDQVKFANPQFTAQRLIIDPGSPSQLISDVQARNGKKIWVEGGPERDGIFFLTAWGPLQ